jgi:amino acid transporter
VFKLLALVMVIVLGFWKADAANWSDFMPNGVSGMLAGAGSVMIAYLGFDTVCNAAEEATDPARSVPAGIVGTVVISGSIYTLVAAALTLMVPWHEVDLKAPLAAAFQNWLPWMVPVIAFAALVGLFAIGLGCILTSSRLVLTLARDGLIPRGLGALSEMSQAPVTATVVTASTAIALSLLCTFKTLIMMISIGTIASLSMVCLSLVLARKRNPDGGGSLSWLLVVFVVLFFSVMALSETAPTAALLAGICLLGVFVWILTLPDAFVPKDTFAAPAGCTLALVGTLMNVVMMWSLEVQGRYVTAWLVFGNIWYLVYGQYSSSLATLDEMAPLSRAA